MEIWIILALVAAAAEIFGRKNKKKEPPKQNRMPEEYREYNDEYSYEYDAEEEQAASAAPAPRQGQNMGLPHWLEDALEKAASTETGKKIVTEKRSEWQEMLRPEPVYEQPVPVQPKPVPIQPKEVSKPPQKASRPSHKPASVAAMQADRIVLEEVREALHPAFRDKTVQDIKEVIVLSELLGPPLALRKGKHLI